VKARTYVPLLLIALTSFLPGCSSPNARLELAFPIQVLVRSTESEPLRGAEITVNKLSVGCTDALGKLAVNQSGREGQAVAVQVRCPSGYRSPEVPEVVRLANTRALDEASGTAGTMVEFACESELRDVVLVVRAQGGPNLPVVVDGTAAGVTDSDGYAHLLLRLDRKQNHVELGMDTEQKRSLLPRNPSRNFALGSNDAIVLYEEHLSMQKAKPKSSQSAKLTPHRPLPIRLN